MTSLASATEPLPTGFAVVDDPACQEPFTQPAGAAGLKESCLVVDGVHCAQCAVAIEDAVGRLPGVQRVEVNVATRRARIVWDPARLKLSRAFAAIAGLGYQPFPVQHVGIETARRRERRRALWRLFVAGFCMMQVMMYAVPTYVALPGEITPDIDALLKWASWMLTLPVVLFSSGPFFANALRDLRGGRVGMDVPVALGIGITFVAGTWAVFQGGGEVYFDSLTMFVFFLLGGRYLEVLAREKAAMSLESLARRLPGEIERLPAYPDVSRGERVPVLRLAQGDVVRVRVGEAFPGDGTVLDGQSRADESLLTGESRAVEKGRGDGVLAGSHNLTGPLIVRVEAVGRASRFGQIVDLMERAAAEKPRLAALADRYAQVFLVAVLVLALAGGVGWSFVDPHRALWVAVSVLIVTCPCALSLATPAAVLAATGRLARSGVLVRHPDALDALAACDRVVFDKTGTLTEAALRLAETRVLREGFDADQAVALAAAMERGSLHPIAQALRETVKAASDVIGLEGVVETPGRGLSARWAGRRLRLGQADWACPGTLIEAGTGAHALLADEAGPVALFVFDESLRGDARDAVEALKAAGLKASMLSGDRPAAVADVAARLGVDDAQGGLLPEDKLARLVAWQAAGEKVLMVGDGINDGPTLSRADASVAIGSGAPLSQSRADLVLLSNRLADVPLAIRVARRMQTVIRQNLAWAAVYNAASVPLALMGYLPPWLAGLGMAASSLLVVLNALRLAR